VTVSAGPVSTRVLAKVYRHPQLGDRPVVRLVGESTAPAQDAAMTALGFTGPRRGEPVACGRTRDRGYPAWALAHDPAGALAALAAVPALERAARLAGSRPGLAASAYSEIAESLPPAHLPSFWEQAGRHYLAAGQPQQAGAMFGRAREAERAHARHAPEPVRRAAFLEFALAGALPGKAIDAYIAELATRHDPGKAYRELVELAERHTLGGLPPWTGLPKQLRSLAKAAGLDGQAEEQRVLSCLLTLPAVRSAPSAFWQAYRPRLVRLAKRSAELRHTLLHLFPEAFPEAAMDDWWLDLLDEAGALRDLACGEADPSDWLTRMATHLKRGRRPSRAPRRLLDLVPRLGRGTRPVRLAEGTSWRARYLDANLLDACLAAGLPVEDPRPDVLIDLSAWLRGRDRALVAVATDARYGPLLAAAVDAYARERGMAELLQVAALRPLARDWILARAAEAVRGGLADASETVARLESFAGPAGPAVPAVLPPARAAIRRIDLAVPLRRTLAAGILDELGWEALDAVADELGVEAEISASWPVLTVYNRRRAVAVGPEGPVAEHDLRLPPAAHAFSVLYSAGAFLVAWYDGHARRAYWSNDRSRVRPLPGEGRSVRARSGYGYAFLTAGGARITGHSPLLPGDMRVRDTPRLLSDGVTYWAHPEVWRPELRTLDPVTGELGRPSRPAFLDDAVLPGGHAWAVEACTLAPLPLGVRHSPLGTDGTRLGFRVSKDGRGGYRVEGVDCRRADLVARDGLLPWGLLGLPGGAAPMVVAGDSIVWLLDPADGAGHWQVAIGHNEHWTPATAGFAARGTPIVPPPAFWHFLTPRDPAGSAALRNISPAAVRALLDAALADLAGDPRRTALPALERATAALVTHPRLRVGLAGVVRQAADLRLRLDRLTAGTDHL
jgi:hypothetical protein